jgi:hypothetical protein
VSDGRPAAALYSGRVAARRLIFLMLALLLISSIAAALAPVRDPGGESTESEPPPVAEEPRGELVRRTIAVAKGKPETIELALGDELALTVTARRFSQIEIPGLGELADADPEAPARFDLLPRDPGRYEVRLLDSRRTLGWIEVTGRRPEERPAQPDAGGEPSSSDSPGSSTAASTAGARSAS